MRYVIIGPDGKAKMGTNYPECMPPPEIQRAMKKSGYKIKVTEEKIK